MLGLSGTEQLQLHCRSALPVPNAQAEMVQKEFSIRACTVVEGNAGSYVCRASERRTVKGPSARYAINSTPSAALRGRNRVTSLQRVFQSMTSRVGVRGDAFKAGRASRFR